MSIGTDWSNPASSPHSRATSPMPSASHIQTQRKSVPTTLGTRLNSTSAMKSLNPTWQVWTNPSAASDTSASSHNHQEVTQSESGYVGEYWRAPRVSGAQWEEPDSNNQKSSSHGPTTNQYGRQRSAGNISTLNVASAPASKNGRYDRGMGRDPAEQSAYGPTSPSKPVNPRSASPFTAQESQYHAPSGMVAPYDAYQPPDPMFSSPALASAPAATFLYPGMSPYGHQGLTELPSPHLGMFYNYSGASRPGSHYYYPPQPMPFQHLGPPPIPAGGSPVFSKKRVGQPQQMSPQISPQGSVFTNISSSPLLAHRGYVPVEYPVRMPVAHPMYGQREAGSPLHIQQFNMRGRRLIDDPNAYRSPLLEEFRNDRVRNWELKDLYGHIVEFSMDQHGSRFIQQRLETATEDERQIIFDEIMPQYALQLIQDVFGNYVIQKFLEYGTTPQKAILVSCMQGHVLLLSLQMYGCRVVQKAVETLTPEQQSLLVRELDENVLRCVKDANGNHVIQRLLERVDPERLTFVRFFSGHVQDLATHPYGCRVLQRCFEHLPEAHTRPLLEELQRHAIRLMQDQFGNYVIQFVLENGLEQDRLGIIAQLRGRMLQMSRHKFASNVCEKALITADPDSRRQMIEEIMRQRQDGSSPVVTMMKDQYGNYVLQRAISVAEAEQRTALIERIRPHLTTLRKRAGQSRHLVAIERLLVKYSAAPVEGQAAGSSSETTEPVANITDDAPAETK